MELLRTWLNDDLGLSRPVDSFEADFANGYLIGEVLLRHGLLPNADSLADKSTPMAMVTNFNLLQQPLLDLGVDFSSKVANAIMTEKKNVATAPAPMSGVVPAAANPAAVHQVAPAPAPQPQVIVM